MFEWEQVLKRKKVDFSVFREALLRQAGNVVRLDENLTKKILDEYIELYTTKHGKSPTHGFSRERFEERIQEVLRQSGGKVLVNNGYTRQFSDETFSDGGRQRGYIYTRGE